MSFVHTNDALVRDDQSESAARSMQVLQIAAATLFDHDHNAERTDKFIIALSTYPWIADQILSPDLECQTHDGCVVIQFPCATGATPPVKDQPLSLRIADIAAQVMDYDPTKNLVSIRVNRVFGNHGSTLVKDVDTLTCEQHFAQLKGEIISLVQTEGGNEYLAALMQSGFLEAVQLGYVRQDVGDSRDLLLFTHILDSLRGSITKIKTAAAADPDYAIHAMDEWRSELKIHSTKTIRHSDEVGTNSAEFLRSLYEHRGYLPEAIERKVRMMLIQGLGHDFGKTVESLRISYNALREKLIADGHRSSPKFQKFFAEPDDCMALLLAIFEHELDFADMTPGHPAEIASLVIRHHDHQGYLDRIQSPLRTRLQLAKLSPEAIAALSQPDAITVFFDSQIDGEFRPEVFGMIAANLPGISPEMLCRAPLGHLLRARTPDELAHVLHGLCLTEQDRAAVTASVDQLPHLLTLLTECHARFAMHVHDFLADHLGVEQCQSGSIADLESVVDQILRFDDVRVQYMTGTKAHHLSPHFQQVRIGTSLVSDVEMGVLTFMDMLHARKYRTICAGRTGSIDSRRANLEEALLVIGTQLQEAVVAEFKRQALAESWYVEDSAIVLSVPRRLFGDLRKELQANTIDTVRRVERIFDNLCDVLPGLQEITQEVRSMLKERLSTLFCEGLEHGDSFALVIAADQMNQGDYSNVLVGYSRHNHATLDYVFVRPDGRDSVADFASSSHSTRLLGKAIQELEAYNLANFDKEYTATIASTVTGIRNLIAGLRHMKAGRQSHQVGLEDVSVANELAQVGIQSIRATVEVSRPVQSAA